ncbi:hypothetical protein [Thiomicrorhabdus sp.]|jgi:uncharacterized protein YcfL|uniref:hypothetical protein n=1 Tax=Thiomicrorhabdus sp. TaxID=2039724 RepID=UPI003563077B
MKQTVIFSGLASIALALAACTSHHFVNKVGQNEKQFIQDQAYCRGLASGQQSLTNTEGERLIPYEECMRNLGYLPK